MNSNELDEEESKDILETTKSMCEVPKYETVLENTSS
jgi:hypothetical protein